MENEELLTELQKNVAVRLLMGHKAKDVATDYGVGFREIANWLKAKAFTDYMNDLGTKNREKIMQYLEARQQKCVTRLEELSEQSADLKVARQSTVDLLGYSGMENKNVAPPVINNTNVFNPDNKKADDIDKEIKDVDDILKGDKKEKGK